MIFFGVKSVKFGPIKENVKSKLKEVFWRYENTMKA